MRSSRSEAVVFFVETGLDKVKILFFFTNDRHTIQLQKNNVVGAYRRHHIVSTSH